MMNNDYRLYLEKIHVLHRLNIYTVIYKNDEHEKFIQELKSSSI